MTTKQHILDEIRRLAMVRGGGISIRAFCAETEIPQHHILGLHWAKWNDALSEAGVNTGSFFVQPTEDSAVVEAFAHLIKKLKRWPTQYELQMERRRNKSFPSVPVIRRVRKTSPFASRLVSYCAERADLADVATIATEVAKSESHNVPIEKNASIIGYVYMMKSGRRYKIGHTKSPSRRHREVRLDLPDPTHPSPPHWQYRCTEWKTITSRQLGPAFGPKWETTRECAKNEWVCIRNPRYRGDVSDCPARPA